MAAIEPTAKQKIVKLIPALTRNGDEFLDEIRLKELKLLCRESDENIKTAYDCILTQLNARSSRVRYSTMHLLDVLFTRSSYFRRLTVVDIPKILELTAGINGKILPQPANFARKLKALCVGLIKQWQEKFGSTYMQLSLASDYLKNNARVYTTDANIITHSDRIHQMRIEENRAKSARYSRLLRIEAEMQEKSSDIVENLSIMGNSFEILVPKPMEDVLSNTDTCIDYDNSQPTYKEVSSDGNPLASLLRKRKTNTLSSRKIAETHGLGSVRYELTITLSSHNPVDVSETFDNAIVYENLRASYKLMLKHLDFVSKWLTELMKLDVEDDKKREALMKEAIDLKRALETAKTKSEELRVHDGVTRIASDSDADSDFEEVVIPEFVQGKSTSDVGSSLARTTQPSGTTNRDNRARSQEPSLNVFQSTKLDIQPCRAPLKNGHLCPRRDMIRCPFHGIIIPRDEQGVPIQMHKTPCVEYEIIHDDVSDEEKTHDEEPKHKRLKSQMHQ
ncbi:5687_t:CDS:2 [Paraglomus occultum]|uniref:5687_t:CDS:1 n=1 Tax=Paraglomus occultum TaxID=144539 RepID=A0A9N9GDR5_9GLOM|nr:5687_t:CDS:2 [Paraglomus occultum]